MAMRPCSTNSRKKSSGFSPSVHTRPLLETYQNFPFTPAGANQWIIFRTMLEEQTDMFICKQESFRFTFYIIGAIIEDQ